jgi:hypothetical protein
MSADTRPPETGLFDLHNVASTEPAREPDTGEACFYVLDARSVVGNCAMWWCPDGQGYTCDIAKAGLYTARRCAGMRETDIPVHRDVVAELTVKHVRLDHLRQAGALDAFDAREKPAKRRAKVAS